MPSPRGVRGRGRTVPEEGVREGRAGAGRTATGALRVRRLTGIQNRNFSWATCLMGGTLYSSPLLTNTRLNYFPNKIHLTGGIRGI